MQENEGTIVVNHNTYTFNIGTMATTESIAELTTSIAQRLGDRIKNMAIESPQGPKILFDQKDR